MTALLRLPGRVRSSVASSSYGTLNVPLEAVATDSLVTVPEGGVVVDLPAPRRVSRLTAALTGSYDYRVQVLDGSTVVATLESPRLGWQVQGEARRELTLTPAVTATSVRIRCGRGFGRCALGQVVLGD
jgi:hypothetical protein